MPPAVWMEQFASGTIQTLSSGTDTQKYLFLTKPLSFFSIGLNIVTLFLIVRLYTLKDFVHYFLIKVLDMHSLGVQLAQLIL